MRLRPNSACRSIVVPLPIVDCHKFIRIDVEFGLQTSKHLILATQYLQALVNTEGRLVTPSTLFNPIAILFVESCLLSK